MLRVEVWREVSHLVIHRVSRILVPESHRRNTAPSLPSLSYLGFESEAKKYQYWKSYKQTLIIKQFLKKKCVTFSEK